MDVRKLVRHVDTWAPGDPNGRRLLTKLPSRRTCVPPIKLLLTAGEQVETAREPISRPGGSSFESLNSLTVRCVVPIWQEPKELEVALMGLQSPRRQEPWLSSG